VACSPEFLLFGGQVFTLFAAYAGSSAFTLDDSDSGYIFFHWLYFKVSLLVYYYPFNIGSRCPAPDRRNILVGVLFPADPDRMPVSLYKLNARDNFVDSGMERAENEEWGTGR